MIFKSDKWKLDTEKITVTNLETGRITAFHEDFIRGKVTLVGCPKLDGVDYSEKLAQIIRNNDVQSVTVVRMEVPCCGGLEFAVKKALQQSGKFIPWQVVTVGINGSICD